ncbi:unnamed protein product [Phytomonas sp. Hart1]|nr:unnamed protein product [Phytomonas sp. Hart1]|eukprot:CCW67225.1 unnamed protein product [Phytomonas sp. isolate Hart1]
MIYRSRLNLQKKLANELLLDGQNSVTRLLCVPFTFLSLVSETDAVARTFASAIAFLEGFSTESLETDISIEQNALGHYSFHSKVKFVPYRSTIESRSSQQSTPMDVLPKPLSDPSSQRSTIAQKSWNEKHIDLELREAIAFPFLQIDGAIDTLLRRADALSAAKIVIEFCSEAGILVSSSTIIDIFERLRAEDYSLANQIVKQYEAELESLPNMSDILGMKYFSFMNDDINSSKSNSIEKHTRRSSKLQRIRKPK